MPSDDDTVLGYRVEFREHVYIPDEGELAGHLDHDRRRILISSSVSRRAQALAAIEIGLRLGRSLVQIPQSDDSRCPWSE